ncbi:HAD-IIA family hydrolase [Paenibacillus marinisediminis]
MRGYIFDLDGTVYLGERVIEGAVEAIEALRARGDKVMFLSNKPIATRVSYAHKLSKMGIPTTDRDIMNSSSLVAKYMRQISQPGDQILVIGEEPIRDEMRNEGLQLSDHDVDAPYVVLSWDRHFTYDKLNVLYQAVIRGAHVIISNPDRTCPMENGQVPDTGALIGALEGALGVPLDATMATVVGKPSAIAAKMAAAHLQLESDQCYMVGDRLETDILLANENGMNSVLVLTGITEPEMVDLAHIQAKYVINSIADVVNL